ncbi:MAG: hypothetical protein AAF804_20680 [Bacteroidota bacterium]
MKITRLYFLLLAVLIGATACSNPTRVALREDKQVRKASDRDQKDQLREIKDRAVREARQEAKRLERKEDYSVFPGAMPMDKQLERVWMKQYAENPDGSQKYLFADGNGVGKTQTAAEMQAMEAAKLQLAGQISNEINQIIEGKIANEQIDREKGQSLTKFVAGSKNYIVQHLQYVKPAFKVYREVGKRDLEVFVKMYYNVEEAMQAAERALEAKARAELEQEADLLIDEINTLLHR